MKKLLIVLATILILTACGEGEFNSSAPPAQGAGGKSGSEQIDQVTPSSAPFIEEELQLSTKTAEGDFELVLHTKKTHYAIDELIEVYAELIYIGEKPQIAIGHSMYPVGFDIREHTRNLHIVGAMAEPYIVTDAIANEPLRYDYSFSGGYSDADDNDYVAFIKEIQDNALPEGQYTITAYASFNEHLTLEQEQAQEDRKHYAFSGSISFVVGSADKKGE